MPSRHTRYQAVVLRDDDTLPLLRCIFGDGRDWWMLPGGGREDGETEGECIVREVREETGLDVAVERLLMDQPTHPPDDMYVRWRTYLCRIARGTAAPGGGEGPNAEIVDLMWLPLFDECAWPDQIRVNAYLSPQLRAFRAALTAPVRAVLFDLDDTLLDRRATVDHYLAGHAARSGLSSDVAASYRARFHDLDACGYAPRAILFDQLSAEFPQAGATADLTNDWLTHAWDTCLYMDGATDLLTWCRSIGLKTAIVTNGRSSMQRAKIESLGVGELVDHVLVSGEEGVAKPASELFRRAAARLDVAHDECVFVGDNPRNDIAGAIAAGMRAIWLERDLEWPADSPRSVHSVVELATLRQILSRPE